jgi:hypothetical protein
LYGYGLAEIPINPRGMPNFPLPRANNYYIMIPCGDGWSPPTYENGETIMSQNKRTVKVNERTVKVVLISYRSRGGYNRWVWRAVECEVGQSGYRSERGVKVLYESQPLYRPNACRGQGPEAEQHANEVACDHAAKVLGLQQEQPDWRPTESISEDYYAA